MAAILFREDFGGSHYDSHTGKELRLVSCQKDGGHVCSFTHFLVEFASHSHADITPMIPMSRPNAHTNKRGFFTACQACETILQREMLLF